MSQWFRICPVLCKYEDFPGGSDGKESASNAGALSSIPGSGGSPGRKWLPTPILPWRIWRIAAIISDVLN